MELPLRIVAVLFVGLVTAAAVLIFATDTINRSRQNLARLTPTEATQLVIDRASVSMEDLVTLAESCYSLATLEKKLCNIVHGNIRVSGAQLDSRLTQEGIAHSASSFSTGNGTVWLYYEPYGANGKPRISFLSQGTGYTALSCTAQGYQCCASCGSGAQSLNASCGSGQRCCQSCSGTNPPGNPPTNYNLVVWPTAAAKVQTPLTLTININNANKLAGVEFRLNFDTNLFTAGTFTAGSFFSSCPINSYAAGIWRISCVQFSGTKTGSGTLGTITLTPKAQTTAQITITNVAALNATGGVLPFTTNSPISVTIT